MNDKYIKRSNFLLALRKTYEEYSMDYLLALRDGLNLIILGRVDSSAKPLEEYKGYIKYV